LGNEIVIITIDGKEVFCEDTWTILKAANSIGIDIPTLCYHPEISVTGTCRICSVEIAGEDKLFTACSTPVKNGMVIYTSSAKVVEARRVILEMILSQHYGDCLTCDASGECLLEKYAYDYGCTGNYFSKIGFNEKIHGIDDKNPFIILDRGKCILCGRCIRACNEWSHRSALSFVDKGNIVKVSTSYNKGLEANNECIFCGNCITVCPVGALSEKQAVRAGRIPEIKKTRTICPYCGVGCGIVVYSKNNKVIKIRGDEKSPVSKGRLCIKGKFGFDFINSPERLTKPLIKNKNGEFEEAEFIDAIFLIKQKIDEIKAKNGGFAGLASARCTNEDNFVFQKFFRSVLSSDNIDHCARICHSPSVVGLSMTLGSGAMTNPIEDIEHVDCFFIIGSNMTSTHPIISWKVITRIKQGALLILVDPKKSELSKYATIHLQLNPGSDIALINSMMKIIIEERMFDDDMVENRTAGFEELKSSLESQNLSDMVKETGLNEDDITLAARLFAISGSSSVFYAMGITQHIFGTANVISLSNLAVICGKVGRGYTGINPLRGQNNVQGSCDMGVLPGILPGYKNIDNDDERKFIEDLWGRTLPDKKGLTAIEITNAIVSGDINFIYIMGENPVMSDPDSDHVKNALDKADFVVVQDIFMTETAKYADVILPAASFAEKDGTFTNTERRVQRINKLIEPSNDSVMPDWMIITRLAELFDHNWGYKDWTAVFQEIRKAAPIYAHIDPELLEKKEFFWPADEMGASIQRLHTDSFTKGKASLIYRDFIPSYKTSASYPFLMIIGREYEHYHTGTMTRKSEGINHLKPSSTIMINPKNAVKLKVKTGDVVTIKAEHGEIESSVVISLEVKPDTVYTTFHYIESPVNHLTNGSNLDPESKMAAMKVVKVKIEKKN